MKNLHKISILNDQALADLYYIQSRGWKGPPKIINGRVQYLYATRNEYREFSAGDRLITLVHWSNANKPRPDLTKVIFE